MKQNAHFIMQLLLFAFCLLVGVFFGIWLSAPLLGNGFSYLSSGSTAIGNFSIRYILFSGTTNLIFVLAVRLFSCFRFRRILLSLLMVIHGCLFGFRLCSALHDGSSAMLLVDIGSSLVILTCFYVILYVRPHKLAG